MSFVSGVKVAPKLLTAVAGALQGIDDEIAASGVAADRVAAAVVAPGADEVSVAAAKWLRGQADGYWRVSGPVVVSFGEFVAALSTAADAYSTTEADNATHTG